MIARRAQSQLCTRRPIREVPKYARIWRETTTGFSSSLFEDSSAKRAQTIIIREQPT
jgi:hypothetical protein